MAEINDLSTTDASNTATGWSEGMAPSNVNNAARADLGIIARYIEHAGGEGLVATTETGVNSLSVALQRASLTNTASASGSTGYIDGLSMRLTVPSTITAVPLLSINGKKKHPIIGTDNVTLSSSDILAGVMIDVGFDASAKAWRMLSPKSKVDGKATKSSLHLPEGSAPSTAASEGALYTKDTGGQPELFYREESDGDEVQLTSGGSLNLSVTLPKNYLTGMQLSNGTDADHDIDITAGECRGSDDDEDIVLSAITKRGDATWVAGTGNGGLSSSLTALAANTWYHVIAGNVGGSGDVGFDTDVAGANLVTDHSFTAVRRIGSFLTDGTTPGNIIGFWQNGDDFGWTDPSQDYSADPGTSEVSTTLTVPTGVSVRASLAAYQQIVLSGNVSGRTAIYHPDTAGAATDAILAGDTPGGSGLGGRSAANIWVRTNTSAQVQHISEANVGTLTLITMGWMDDRGRNS